MLAILHLKEQFSHSFRSLLQICLYEIQSATKTISRCSSTVAFRLRSELTQTEKGQEVKYEEEEEKVETPPLLVVMMLQVTLTSHQSLGTHISISLEIIQQGLTQLLM